MKKCGHCNVDKPADQFYSDKRTKTGLSSWCRTCNAERLRERRKANPELTRLMAARYAATQYEKNRDTILKNNQDKRLLYRYGIDRDEYENLLGSQDGKCSICKRAEADSQGHKLCVDHDHETGVVRGLLCRSCNMRLGILEDLEWVAKAQDYLRITEQ